MFANYSEVDDQNYFLGDQVSQKKIKNPNDRDGDGVIFRLRNKTKTFTFQLKHGKMFE